MAELMVFVFSCVEQGGDIYWTFGISVFNE